MNLKNEGTTDRLSASVEAGLNMDSLNVDYVGLSALQEGECGYVSGSRVDRPDRVLDDAKAY